MTLFVCMGLTRAAVCFFLHFGFWKVLLFHGFCTAKRDRSSVSAVSY